MFSLRVTAVVVATTVLVAACGDDGPDRAGMGIAANAGTLESPRTIEIAMVDIAFEPKAVTVQAGETIRFRFSNKGAIPHEATFGDEAEQEEHGAQMSDMGSMDMGTTDMGTTDMGTTDMGTTDMGTTDMGTTDMGSMDESEAGHGNDEAGDDGHDAQVQMIAVQPGTSTEVIITFDDPAVSSTIIGCHQPGHWEAGMRVDVTVATA